MKCADIMKRNVECVFPEDTAQAAAVRMRDGNLGFLPVCDEHERAIGTVTDRDIAVRLVAEGGSPGCPIGDVMTRDVITCRPEDEVQVAEDLMARHRVARIICVDETGK